MNNNVLLVVVLLLTASLFLVYQAKKKGIVNPGGQQAPLDPQFPNTPPSMQPPQTQPPTQPPMQNNRASSYREALRMSQQQSKPIFLFFGASWCHWCEKMKKETLADPGVRARMRGHIIYLADKDKESALANKYRVSSIPHYMIVTSSERVQREAKGYKDPTEFLAWLSGQEKKERRPRRRRPSPG